MRTYIFIDAENHFHRSVDCAAEVIHPHRAAEALSKAKIGVQVPHAFPSHIKDHRFGFEPDLQLFWDCQVLAHFWTVNNHTSHVYGAARAIYVCSSVGDADKIHDVRIRLRKLGFEPIVVEEPKPNYEQRRANLEQYKILEKPKGCDIALVTRMVADAAADLYDRCFLFASDADYLPAIKAVRQMGKVVCVFGYADILPVRSEYLYVPDSFIDLKWFIVEALTNFRPHIAEALNSIGIMTAPNEPK